MRFVGRFGTSCNAEAGSNRERTAEFSVRAHGQGDGLSRCVTVPMRPVDSIIDQAFWSFGFRVTHNETVVVDLVSARTGSLFKQSSAEVVKKSLTVDFLVPGMSCGAWCHGRFAGWFGCPSHR